MKARSSQGQDEVTRRLRQDWENAAHGPCDMVGTSGHVRWALSEGGCGICGQCVIVDGGGTMEDGGWSMEH